MKYRTFGRLGWQVSEIGFGAWAIGGSWGPQSDEESVRALHTALDAGGNFIDTAQGYGDGKSGAAHLRGSQDPTEITR
jgi:aryl-alcohol dehydrogenase-like predicted oxidoreductase